MLWPWEQSNLRKKPWTSLINRISPSSSSPKRTSRTLKNCERQPRTSLMSKMTSNQWRNPSHLSKSSWSTMTRPTSAKQWTKWSKKTIWSSRQPLRKFKCKKTYRRPKKNNKRGSIQSHRWLHGSRKPGSRSGRSRRPGTSHELAHIISAKGISRGNFKTGGGINEMTWIVADQ